jgi:hypothetical protein
MTVWETGRTRSWRHRAWWTRHVSVAVAAISRYHALSHRPGRQQTRPRLQTGCKQTERHRPGHGVTQSPREMRNRRSTGLHVTKPDGTVPPVADLQGGGSRPAAPTTRRSARAVRLRFRSPARRSATPRDARVGCRSGGWLGVTPTSGLRVSARTAGFYLGALSCASAAPRDGFGRCRSAPPGQWRGLQCSDSRCRPEARARGAQRLRRGLGRRSPVPPAVGRRIDCVVVAGCRSQ